MGTDGAGLDFFLSLLALSVLVVPKFRNGLKENNENQICHKPQEGKDSFHITIPRTIAHEKVVKRL